MRVTTSDGKAFTLQAEDDADREFLSALHLVRHVDVVRPLTERREGGGWTVTGYQLIVDDASPGKLVSDTANQALRSLGDLLRIGLGQAAQHGHVGALPADPQLQVAAATLFEQLQPMVQALGDRIGKLEAVVQEVRRAHLLTSEKASIAREGGAA